jgi:hypothetical protein
MGVQVTQTATGYEFVSTGMASEDAIASGRRSQMEATSREAAELMIRAELSKVKYKKGTYKFIQHEYFDGGVYCTVKAVYEP